MSLWLLPHIQGCAEHSHRRSVPQARHGERGSAFHGSSPALRHCLVGFLLALAFLGVNFTNITIIGGALGVGIGFGLQTIVNNFVSGLILLFERPVRVGDYVEVGGLWVEIKKIGLRATVVETFDRADMIVPNSDFISNQVTNWTRTNRIIRLRIPVGVAYGSDVPLVMKILPSVLKTTLLLLSTPKPQVLFRGFGESSLDFEVRVHTRR